MSLRAERQYEFGAFRVDPLKRRLTRDGEAVALTSKGFDTLLLLVERRGEVVTKDEMMRSLWRDTVVEENNLTQQVSVLRKVLGERAHEHRYVVTVPGRGYSFVASVREVCGEDADARGASPDSIHEQHTRSLVAIDLNGARGEKTGRSRPHASRYNAAAGSSSIRPRHVFLIALVACGLLAAALAHTIQRRGGRGDVRRQPRQHRTENVGAYEAYLRGRYFWNKRNGDGLKRSAGYFQQAIDSDPGYALAYAGLADANALLADYGLAQPSTEDGVSRARAAAVRALEIDETVAEAHASLGALKLYHDADTAAAESEFRRAIELNPSYATAHHWYSDCLAMDGRPAEAMDEIVRAHDLDPLSPIIGTTLAERLYYARRYDESIAQLRKTLEVEPDFIPARFVLGLAYEQKGMFDEAIAELRRARELSRKSGGMPTISSALGHGYAAAGMAGEARRVLDELIRLDDQSPYEIATVYAGLGERRQALAWLGKTEARKARWLLETDPRLDLLRPDPQFQDLLRARRLAAL